LKLQDPLKQFPPFDVAAGQAAIYLEKGYLEVKPVEPPKAAAVLSWSVRDGVREGDFQHGPWIHASCPACGEKWWTEGNSGKAHLSLKIYHCGQRGVMCPTDVAAEYLKRYAAWRVRSPKSVEKVSSHTPLHIDRKVPGFKTREQLIAEAQAALMRVG
jgi:hypothetical protein